MSQENVELVRDAFRRTYECGERAPLPDLWHDEAEYHPADADPDGVLHGIEAIGRGFRSWEEAYPDLRSEPVEYKDKDDHVFVWAKVTGHGAASGVPVETEHGQIWTLRDGKVIRVVEFVDRDKALKALGLEE